MRTRIIAAWIPLLVLPLPSRAEDTEADAVTPAPEAEADDEGSEPPLITFEQVVTARREPQDSFAVDRSVSVMRGCDLAEAAPRTAPEALWDAPGVFVQQTNHGGGSPIVRGMIGPQVLLLVDGVRFSNSTYRTGPLQYLNLIDPLHLDRMEVLRGAGSVLYGSDAMGGVIHALPYEPRVFEEAGYGGRLRGRYASADRGRSIHARLEGGSGGISVLGGGVWRRLDDLVAGGDIGEQPYSGYGGWSAHGAVVYRLPESPLDDARIKLCYLGTAVDDAGRTDKLYDKKSLTIYDNAAHLLYGRFEATVPRLLTGLRLTMSFQNNFERKDGYKVADDLATRLSGMRDEVQVDTFGEDAQFVTRLLDDRLRVRLGEMFYRDWVGSQRQTWSVGTAWVPAADQAYPDDSTYDVYGAYLLLEGDPLQTDDGHVLRLGFGYRFHGMAGHAPATEDLPAVDFDSHGHVFLGSAQYLYRDTINAALTFSQGFRAPNLQEAVQLGDTGKFFHVPNHDLAPERADTLELMLRARIWRLELGLAGYVTWLEDLIKREDTTWEGQDEIDGKPVVLNLNGRQGVLWGIEPQLRLDIGWGLSLSGHLTHTWGEERIDEGKDLPLTRVPPLFGTVKLRYDAPPLQGFKGFLELFVRGADKQDRLSREDESDARIPEDGTPGWWTLNLRLGALALDDHLRAAFTVENLLNEEYKYHASGVYAPGVNAVLSMEGQF